MSQNRKTIIVGEDLGNVPEGFRPALKKADVLGYRVLYFEDVGPDLLRASKSPSLSLACLSTHDLPPLLGWWDEDDIAFSQDQGWLDNDAAELLHEERLERKEAMLRTAIDGGFLSHEAMAALERKDPQPEIVIGLHRLLAHTNSLLVAPRLADMVGERRSTNVPGTSEEYPNWRLKLDVPLEDLAGHDLFTAISRAMASERPR